MTRGTRKTAAAKTAASTTPKAAKADAQDGTRGLTKWSAFNRTRGLYVGGQRDNREEAQTIVDGLLEAGFSAEVRKV